MAKLNLAVIFGGQSGEHEVSVHSARQVIAALDASKYNVIPIAITKQGVWLVGAPAQKYLKATARAPYQAGGITEKYSQRFITMQPDEVGLTTFTEGETPQIDLVLPIGHGTNMEDGKLQGMLDLLGIPYVFSGTLASALAMNKYKTKLIVREAGVPVLPDFILAKDTYSENDLEGSIWKLRWPIVIKPLEMGSSVGISIVKARPDFNLGIEEAFKYGNQVMLEKYCQGRELTVAVIGNEKSEALPVTEIIPQISEWYDYKAKYQDGGSKHVCPADLPGNVTKVVQEYAVTAYKALGCNDLARVDFMYDEQNNRLYFIEVNTIPGMTATSLAPEAAKAAGYSFPKFLDKLIAISLQRLS